MVAAITTYMVIFIQFMQKDEYPEEITITEAVNLTATTSAYVNICACKLDYLLLIIVILGIVRDREYSIN